MTRILSFFRACTALACLLALAPVPPVIAADVPFPDMEWSWYRYREIAEELRKRDVLTGYPDGTFKPRQVVNRAEFLTIVFRGRSDAEPVGGECFADVKADAWYTPYVCAAKRRGIIEGYPDGSFKPEQGIVMAEAMKMLQLAYDREPPEKTPGRPWYEPFTASFDRDGVLPRSSYIPWAPLTRERAADLLWRFLESEDGHKPSESSGCGKAVSAVPQTTMVDGVERSFLTTMPSGYRPQNAYPLIVAFHGRTNSNEQVKSYYGLDRAAKNYMIAYPAAQRNGANSFSWTDKSDKPGTVHDVKFFDAIVRELSERYCIDMDKIFVVGHSLGAWMANSVACLRGGVVRASGTVGGDAINTACTGPAAGLISHNPHDTLASFASTERAHERRMRENACEPAMQSAEPQSLLCQSHTVCDDGKTLLWCPHELDRDNRGAFYPHQWPWGFGEQIVEFFNGLE